MSNCSIHPKNEGMRTNIFVLLCDRALATFYHRVKQPFFQGVPTYRLLTVARRASWAWLWIAHQIAIADAVAPALWGMAGLVEGAAAATSGLHRRRDSGVHRGGGCWPAVAWLGRAAWRWVAGPLEDTARRPDDLALRVSVSAEVSRGKMVQASTCLDGE